MNYTDLNVQRTLWDKVLKNIEESGRFQKPVFNSFFKKTFISDVEGDKIIVGCESGAVANVLKNNFKDIFLVNVSNVTGTNFDVVFVPITELKIKTKQDIIKEATPVYFKSAYIDNNFTFDKFVEGPSNTHAKKAAILVASNPGIMYNPFYIQGDSGLGKTHLLHSIAHLIKSNNPERKILCTSSQYFFEEYINFTRNSSNSNDLIDFIKSNDVLLIDDIQQLKGKEKTLDFFFDIYTYFINNNKQIVITSDRPQNELDGIPNRLVTRFLNGLTVSISKPDFSTCKEILLKKIEYSNLSNDSFTDDAINFIASHYSNSIRELEGVLTRLTFYSTINDMTSTIDLPFVLEALDVKDVSIDRIKKVDSSRIINCVADYYSLSSEQIKGENRKAQVALARQIAIYLIRDVLDAPYTEIGRIFNRDHSTIMHSVSKVEKKISVSPSAIRYS